MSRRFNKVPMEENTFPIDAVITWVDGNDPLHKTKMQRYLGKKPELDNKTIAMRYGQINEIEFAVKSIMKFAPFIRNIFIVSDQQTPDFLSDPVRAKKEFPKVSIIDHKVIFKNHPQYLPNFNSRSIASLLYEIPNLSEHFIYFNDDFFLLNEVKEEDFFIDKKPVIRGEWTRFYENIWYKKAEVIFKSLRNKKVEVKAGYKLGQQTIARLLGFKKYLRIDHCAAPMRRSTLENYFKAFPEVLDCNLKHRFRHPEQYVVQSLSNHLEIKNNTAVINKDFQLLYFQNYKKPLFWIKYKLNKGAKDKNKLFLCMQSLDHCPKDKLAFVVSFFDKHFK